MTSIFSFDTCRSFSLPNEHPEIYFCLLSWTVVILLVADHPSKELLTEYTVPLGHLKPLHQYHLELVQVLSILGHFGAFLNFLMAWLQVQHHEAWSLSFDDCFCIIFMDNFAVPSPLS